MTFGFFWNPSGGGGATPDLTSLLSRVSALEAKNVYVDATTAGALDPGLHLFKSSGGGFAATLNYVAGRRYEIRDADNLSLQNVTLGTATDTFNVGDDTNVAGPFTFDVHHSAVEVVADPATADLYHIYYLGGIVADPVVPPEQLTAILPFSM